MTNAARIFDRLREHFLVHPPVRRWLLGVDGEAPAPLDIARGVGFVCSFPVPGHLAAFSSAFDFGELVVPQRVYGGLVLGTITGALEVHKLLACVAPQVADGLSMSSRRIAMDFGAKPTDPIMFIDYTRMSDGSLVVVTKQLAPADSQAPVAGALAFYHKANHETPVLIVSFAEPSGCDACAATPCLCCEPSGAVAQHCNDVVTTPSDALVAACVSRAKTVRMHPNLTVTTRIGDSTAYIGYSQAKFYLSAEPAVAALRQIATLAATIAHPANTISTRLISSVDANQIDAEHPDILVALDCVTRVTESTSCESSREGPESPLNLRKRDPQLTLPPRIAALRTAESVVDGDDPVYSPVSPNSNCARVSSRVLFDFPATVPPPASDTSADAYQRLIVPAPLGPADASLIRAEAAREKTPRAKRERSIATRSPGVCEVCSKCFFKSGALARHMRTAHPNLPNTQTRHTPVRTTERLDCPRCDKTFSQQGSLNRHLRSIHESRKLHCQYCTLAFGQAFDLKRHQKRKHPGHEQVVPREARPAFAVRGRTVHTLPQRG